MTSSHNDPIEDRKLLLKLIESRLLERGFETLHSKSVRTARVFRHADGRGIVLPTDADVVDFDRVLENAFRFVSQSSMSLNDAKSLLLLPESGIVRLLVEGAEFASGTASIDQIKDIFTRLRNLLRISAASASSKMPAHASFTRVPSIVEDFTASCRVGQTEFGSYGLKVFCPLSPPGAFTSVRVGSLALQYITDHIKTIQEFPIDHKERSVPPGLTAAFATAFSKLRIALVRGGVLSASIFKDDVLTTPAGKAESFYFRRNDFEKAEMIGDWIVSLADKAVDTIEGEVISLSSEATSPVTGRSGRQITVKARTGLGVRRVRVDVTASQHATAVHAYTIRSPIEVHGIFNIATRRSFAVRVDSINLLDAEMHPMEEE